MKRTVIIFIIACCLISFMEISCLAQDSVKYNLWEKNFNYAEFWNSLSYNEKVIYLLGVSGGIERYSSEIEDFFIVTIKFPYNKLSAEERAEESKKVWEVTGILSGWQSFVSCGGYRAIIKNMDDLYKDSANMYISMIDMGFLSYYKITSEPVELLLKVMRERGESIESLLKELREKFWE